MMTHLIDIPTLFHDLDAGVFAARLNAAMRDTALAVVSTGRKGRVTIVLDLQLARGFDSLIRCQHTVKYALPTDKGKVSEEFSTGTPLHVLPGGVLSLFPEQPDKTVEA